MREIKFRVRDTDNKKIIGYEMFNTLFNNGFCFYYENGEEESELHSELSTPPMLNPLSKFGQLLREQFTGLQDKDGKDIYEGDIVFYEDHEWIVEFYYDRWDMRNGEKYVRDNDFPDDPGSTVWQDCLIIGNIYENPELL
jgi:uncharacterized phage protein (TIGR01671 family)